MARLLDEHLVKLSVFDCKVMDHFLDVLYIFIKPDKENNLVTDNTNDNVELVMNPEAGNLTLSENSLIQNLTRSSYSIF